MASKMKENVIYTEYFGHTEDYKKKFGQNTIVLMQVGSFIEVYGLKGDPIASQIEKYAEICGLNIAEKTHQYRGKTVLMCGFRDYCLDSYLTTLMNAPDAFTVVVFMQDEDSSAGDRKTRSLTAIYSPGTYVSGELHAAEGGAGVSNYILSIWFEPFKTRKTPQLMIGMAACNIFTGKTHFYEYQTTNVLLDGGDPGYTTTFDALEQFMTAFQPNEVLVLSPDTIIEKMPWVLKRVGVKTSNIRIVSSTTDTCAKNCQKQQYMDHLLGMFFGANTFQTCQEFIRHAIGTQALVYLLNYIQEHNTIFAQTIELPPFTNLSNTMILANHSLEQLHIIGTGVTVLSHMDKCRTPMGSRHLRYQLLHPTCDTTFLKNEYRAVQEMLSNHKLLNHVREHLANVYDVEKIAQQIALKKLQPSGIGHLYRATVAAIQVLDEFVSNKSLGEYITAGIFGEEGESSSSSSMFSNLLNILEQQFVIDQCRGTTIEPAMIKRGAFPVLDALMDAHTTKYEEWCGVRNVLNRLIWKAEGEPDVSIEYVKEHKTNVNGYSLIITPTRSNLLKKVLEKPADLPPQLKQLHIHTKSGASNYEVRCEYLNTLNSTIMELLDGIQKSTALAYRTILTTLGNTQWLCVIKKLAAILCRMDFLQSRAYVAHKYKYCCPELEDEDVGGYVDARELRHCLIECLNQREVYVANDLRLGQSVSDQSVSDLSQSMLLYGTNMVGKTSLIRALGISVVLAQAGMFVPCTSFKYRPYHALYTRILGNDNLHQGLSTLAAEMVELREILHYADNRSLVLGDEVCKGTEIESALSIFAAALIHLHQKSVSYIFATHFHAILDFAEIKQMKHLRICHMSVHYDASLDCLVYDRVLREGGGARSYGLEVCKSLHMPREFIDTAYSLRNTYFTESRGELQRPLAVAYNSQKVRGRCEMCNEHVGEEIHHLQEQRHADDDGFIGSVHKNHGGNLASLCEACHIKVHSENLHIVRKKTTDGFRLFQTEKR
jgi:DNA mismatch repair protein MutS